MEVLVSAKLKYWGDRDLTRAPERLELIIKFKEPKKLTKTKISHTLVSRFDSKFKYNYNTYEEYLDSVCNIVRDKNYLVAVVEDLVKEYFKESAQDLKNRGKMDEIYKK